MGHASGRRKYVDHDAITVAVLSGCTAVGIITLIWLRLHQQDVIVVEDSMEVAEETQPTDPISFMRF